MRSLTQVLKVKFQNFFSKWHHFGNKFYVYYVVVDIKKKVSVESQLIRCSLDIYWVLDNYVLNTDYCTSMKAMVHTRKDLITLSTTSLRDKPFTIQKRNINSGNLAGKRHPDREVSKQVLSEGSVRLNFLQNFLKSNFFL